MTERAIRFTQYLLPNGQRREVDIDRPANIADLADKLIARGHRFEIEMLRDMQTVSMTITSNEPGEPDVAIKLCKNGPDIPNAVDTMITAYAKQIGLTNG